MFAGCVSVVFLRCRIPLGVCGRRRWADSGKRWIKLRNSGEIFPGWKKALSAPAAGVSRSQTGEWEGRAGCECLTVLGPMASAWSSWKWARVMKQEHVDASWDWNQAWTPKWDVLATYGELLWALWCLLVGHKVLRLFILRVAVLEIWGFYQKKNSNALYFNYFKM